MRKFFYILIGLIISNGLLQAAFYVFYSLKSSQEAGAGNVNPIAEMFKFSITWGPIVLICLVAGILLGLYLEKLSRSWSYAVRGVVVGIILAASLIATNLSNTTDPVTPGLAVGMIIFWVIVCVIISTIFGKIKNRNSAEV